ncbi:uncharacterized protein TRUGW13939_02379 [Talaromyces rugulosus]|uniref:Glucuronyl hydrolase n=1 Tax=Talaromyces rugulosus TaxID=121627 RepID=A0A7H8QMW6_TALRU|nr:uncharacterized protein TRUGW13939_02379 [Talaromyces rugulosus]QKX55287.1 hypothetical protein TRUGW13939_02379 [Talaromyces rugulosus]
MNEPPQKKIRAEPENTSLEKIPQLVIDSLYSESVAARLWNVACRALGESDPPTFYPEYTGKDGATYVYRHLSFWTSGFFPGSLYLLLERRKRYGHNGTQHSYPNLLQLHHLCQWWSINLYQNASVKSTHDLGFMIAPWATKAWELYKDEQAFSSLVLAAHSLASRFCPKVQSIRSWDTCKTEKYAFLDTSTDFLVIIDNMINLDMLFWVAKQTGNHNLYDIAVAHARTTQKQHIRPDKTTFHVVNFDPEKGYPKKKFTNQGYSDYSCWARGQAWGILGFAQTFHWTKDNSFLQTSQDLADLFIERLPADGVPYWDLDAPIPLESPRDTSAAMIAACGMLLIFKALMAKGRDNEAMKYVRSAMRIARGTCEKFMNPPTLRFTVSPPGRTIQVYEDGLASEYQEKLEPGLLTLDHGMDAAGLLSIKKNGVVPKETHASETILTGATINNYEFAPRRWANHGLVYADYYFMLLGNMLLELGLADTGQ